MSDYTQSIDFSAKDDLTSGNANKLAKGADIDTELALISTAIASKPDQDEIQNNTFTYFTVSGTDTYTATPSPAISAYAAGQEFLLTFTNANTGAATLNLNSLGAKNIVHPNGDPLVSGDIIAAMHARLVYDGTNMVLISVGARAGRLPKNYIDGLLITQDADTDHDINISAGECDNQDNDKDIILGSGITKQIDASWAAGDDAGGFPTGLSLTADTWYHVFVIFNPSTGAVDGGFDTALAATNLLSDASGYTEYRRIGSVLVDGTSNIIAFDHLQPGVFRWESPPTDNTNPADGLITLSVPPDVRVLAHIDAWHDGVVDTSPILQAGDADSANTVIFAQAINQFSGTQTYTAGEAIRLTNTSKQIRWADNTSSGTDQATLGWFDFRGKQ